MNIATYNPAILEKADLIRGFVARGEELSRLLQELRAVLKGRQTKPQVLIGERGSGKTTLLRRLAYAIEDDPQLSRECVAVVFPEQLYGVKNVRDFWVKCVEALGDELDRLGGGERARELDRLAREEGDPRTVLVHTAERLGRGLVLLVDNIDTVADRLSEKDWQDFQGLYFVGASSSGRGIPRHFDTFELNGLSGEERLAILKGLAAESGDEGAERAIEENPGRFRAVTALMGGNPRAMAQLYRVMAQNPKADAARHLDHLLDLNTPEYRARLEELAPQARQVIDALAAHWDPATAAMLTERLKPLSVNQVSAQLKRLEGAGLVAKEAAAKGKKAYFLIVDRPFQLWCLMRSGRRARQQVGWLARFLEARFTREERNLPARREPIPEVRDRFDFHDLESDLWGRSGPGRSERQETMNKLRQRALANWWPDVDSSEMWRLLAGSPHLAFAERVRAAEGLDNLRRETASAVYGRLKRAEDRLKQLFPGPFDAVRTLYETLASGEMADVYDLEGALAAARRLGAAWLPALALSARTNVICNPGKLGEAELGVAQAAWRKMTALPGSEARGWNGLGLLQVERLGNPQEGEASFRRAIAVSPRYAPAWRELGRTLGAAAGREEEALEALVSAAEMAAGEGYTDWDALRLAKAMSASGRRAPALALAKRLSHAVPKCAATAMVLAGLLAMNGEWDKAAERLTAVAEGEEGQPDEWAFGAAAAAGYLEESITLLETTGAHGRWRPLYEALRAARAGSDDGFRATAPEIRFVALEIFGQFGLKKPAGSGQFHVTA